MILRTSRCRTVDHPEFRLEVDDAVVGAETVVAMIERMVTSGAVFEPGQTLQLGWMLTRVEAAEGSELTLLEPDMNALPIRWTAGISNAVRQLMLQTWMLDSVGLRSQVSVPSIRQSALVCSRYDEPSFFMSRSDASNERDSGWYVGCMDPDHDHEDPSDVRVLSLYETLLNQPAIQGFASFPAGSMIVLDQANGLKLVKDDVDLAIRPGSLLDGWFEKARRAE